MSDSDFHELVEGMERFVVKELSSVKKEVIDIKTNINIESKITMTKLSDIEKRIGEIEKKIVNIEETLKRAVGKEVVNLFQQMLEGIEGGHPTPPPTSTPFAQQLSPSLNQEEEDILEKYIQPSTSSDKLTSRQAGFRVKRGQEKEQEQVEESNFFVAIIDDIIGRGVFARRKFKKGDVLLEYKGKLKKGYLRDAENDDYFFQLLFKENPFVIDATEEDGSLGRLINDEKKNPNVTPFVIEDERLPLPRVFFKALKDIDPLDEIRYDYGGGPYAWRRKRVKWSPSWLKTKEDRHLLKLPSRSILLENK